MKILEVKEIKFRESAPSLDEISARLDKEGTRQVIDILNWKEFPYKPDSFGATQFSFSSVFPAVLSLAGWNEFSAGLVVAFALVISVVCRVALGAVADRLGLRRVLAALGAVMSVTSFAAISIDSTSSPAKVATIAAFFGLSAFCSAGIGVAEAIRHVPPSAVSQATAAVIALTFAGALVSACSFQHHWTARRRLRFGLSCHGSDDFRGANRLARFLRARGRQIAASRRSKRN